jgi:hypothetical protein
MEANGNSTRKHVDLMILAFQLRKLGFKTNKHLVYGPPKKLGFNLSI